MPPTALAHLAPIAALVVLIEIAVGTSLVSHVIDRLGNVGRGYAGTTALICAAMTAVGLAIAANAGHVGYDVIDARSAELQTLIHWTVTLLIALGLDGLFSAVGTPIARHSVSAATVAVGAVVVMKTAAYISGVAGIWPALNAVLPATLLSGTVWAGMLLGHWYLVTPSMSFKPLRQSVWFIFVALAVTIVAMAAGIATARTSSPRVLTGDEAFLFWALVVGSGIVFTAAVNGLTFYFARTRANQPATAMLYVLIISVLMGVVPAQLIFLQTGVAV